MRRNWSGGQQRNSRVVALFASESGPGSSPSALPEKKRQSTRRDQIEQRAAHQSARGGSRVSSATGDFHRGWTPVFGESTPHGARTASSTHTRQEIFRRRRHNHRKQIHFAGPVLFGAAR